MLFQLILILFYFRSDPNRPTESGPDPTQGIWVRPDPTHVKYKIYELDPTRPAGRPDPRPTLVHSDYTLQKSYFTLIMMTEIKLKLINKIN